MLTYSLAGLISFIVTVVMGLIFIPILSKIKAGQPILKYVKTHYEKNGTPTMGGLFFIIPTVVVCVLFGGASGRMCLVAIVIGLSYLSVGFIDDLIKIKSKNNEGLKPYQKIIFQTIIALSAGLFAYKNGITYFHLPFSRLSINLKWGSIFVDAIIFIAITNSVNLTDGLDGLASSVSVVYLFFITAIITAEISVLNFMYLKPEEYERLNLLSSCLIGGIIGFLIFNTNKAKVFMGDTGSLSLGGFIGAISIFSSNSFFVPIIGIMFVVSSISVIMQVIYYKRTKKRIFLMAPFHHHLQMKGLSESKISYIYSVITAVFGVICLMSYM